MIRATRQREVPYLVSSPSRGARHYVNPALSGPPWRSLCGKDLDAVTLHAEGPGHDVTCPPCRIARRERADWTMG